MVSDRKPGPEAWQAGDWSLPRDVGEVHRHVVSVSVDPVTSS